MNIVSVIIITKIKTVQIIVVYIKKSTYKNKLFGIPGHSDIRK